MITIRQAQMDALAAKCGGKAVMECTDSHQIEFRFRSSTGHPISDSEGFFLIHPSGQRERVQLEAGDFVRHPVPEGNYRAEFFRFLNCGWNVTEVQAGESVSMKIAVTCFPDGTGVAFRVFRRFSAVSLFHANAPLTANEATTTWKYEQQPFRPAGGEFQFEARIRSKYALSGILTVRPHDLSTTNGVQERLKERGYYQGPLHGQLDNQTTEAVKRFQQAHEPLRVDGQPGPFTRSLL
jgi:hypothetical protein